MTYDQLYGSVAISRLLLRGMPASGPGALGKLGFFPGNRLPLRLMLVQGEIAGPFHSPLALSPIEQHPLPQEANQIQSIFFISTVSNQHKSQYTTQN